MSDDLFKVAAEPKRLVKFAGASHSGITWAAPREYVEQVRNFFAAKTRHAGGIASK